jgi:hypothetical protein
MPDSQIEGADNPDIQQKDGTNVATVNMPASTWHQPRRKEHEQTGGQGNGQAINRAIADARKSRAVISQISEDRKQRAVAARLCRGCPVISECGAAARLTASGSVCGVVVRTSA